MYAARATYYLLCYERAAGRGSVCQPLAFRSCHHLTEQEAAGAQYQQMLPLRSLLGDPFLSLSSATSVNSRDLELEEFWAPRKYSIWQTLIKCN